MIDDTVDGVEPERSSGINRRAALKAGVAAGVGIAAWSGASITSLGGTPAYAQGCTGAVIIDLSAGCRNVDVGGVGCLGLYRYHAIPTPVVVPGFPAGSFTITNNIPEGTCCNVDHTAFLNNNQGLTCAVTIEFYTGPASQPACANRIGVDFVKGPFTPGNPAPIEFDPCAPMVNNPDNYRIIAECFPAGTEGCFE
jgi:hypothetical protein